MPLEASKIPSDVDRVLISVNPTAGARSAKPRVDELVQLLLKRGLSAEEIVRQYPCLRLAEVHAVLAYYHDHEDEVDYELAEEWAQAEWARRETAVAPVAARLKAQKARRGA